MAKAHSSPENRVRGWRGFSSLLEQEMCCLSRTSKEKANPLQAREAPMAAGRAPCFCDRNHRAVPAQSARTDRSCSGRPGPDLCRTPGGRFPRAWPLSLRPSRPRVTEGRAQSPQQGALGSGGADLMLTLYINRLEKCKPLGTCPEFSGRKGFGRTGTGFWRGTEARQGTRQVGAAAGCRARALRGDLAPRGPGPRLRRRLW